MSWTTRFLSLFKQEKQDPQPDERRHAREYQGRHRAAPQPKEK